MSYFPINKFLHGLKRVNGVDRYGRKQFVHRGGGFKFMSLFFDYQRSLLSVPGIVINLFFFKKKRRMVACIAYANGFIIYTPSWYGIIAGNWVFNGKGVPQFHGNRCLLGEIPKGSSFYHLSKTKAAAAIFVRARGTVGYILKKIFNFCLVKLPSGEERAFNQNSWATLGRLSWFLFHKRKLGKAGITRGLGRRPVVRGVAKNPVDHPHGGGEGRTSGGRPSSTPWGVYTKGFRTKKYISPMIIRMRYVSKSLIF